MCVHVIQHFNTKSNTLKLEPTGFTIPRVKGGYKDDGAGGSVTPTRIPSAASPQISGHKVVKDDAMIVTSPGCVVKSLMAPLDGIGAAVPVFINVWHHHALASPVGPPSTKASSKSQPSKEKYYSLTVPESRFVSCDVIDSAFSDMKAKIPREVFDVVLHSQVLHNMLTDKSAQEKTKVTMCVIM